MKSKIAIISLFDYHNYGNSLQRLAVQRQLLERSFEPVSFAIRRHPIIGYIKDFVERPICYKAREIAFKSFGDRFGIQTANCKPQHLIDTLSKGYLGAVIGSDQIWNPLYGLGSRTDGLSCLNGFPGANKIALCPSFGISFMPSEWSSRYSKWLNEFERISVRENDGARIVKELTGRDATVLIDPTMAFGPENWREIANYSKCPRDGYVLSYCLGDDVLGASIRCFANEHNLSVISIMDMQSEWYRVPPDVFIALIDNAEFVFTDSFHATAFSLMMHTEFFITRRMQDDMCNMHSRLETLCDKFNCTNRIVVDGIDIFPFEAINWRSVDQTIEFETKKFTSFLDEELNRIASNAE